MSENDNDRQSQVILDAFTRMKLVKIDESG